MISNVVNPASYSPFVNSFEVETRTSTSNIYAALSQLSTLLNTLPSSFDAIAGSYSPAVYGINTSLTIVINPSENLIPSSVEIVLPPSVSIGSGGISVDLIGITGTPTINAKTVEVTGSLGVF